MSYSPDVHPREQELHYISASDDDIQGMLEVVGVQSFEDLFSHIPKAVAIEDDMGLPKAMDKMAILEHCQKMADRNSKGVSFMGDGLQDYSEDEMVSKVCSIRELTTSYTPYQPERSQGTLNTHWIFQSVIAQITGFEAINASMYDRGSTLFEAMKCALNIQKRRHTVWVSEAIYPGDVEVLKTMALHTDMNLVFGGGVQGNGRTDVEAMKKDLESIGEDLAGVVLPQTSHFGCVEPVDELTDVAHGAGALVIAIVDPVLLAQGALKPPVKWGAQGADLMVAEGQHLALRPNFGGPGLGIFGIRFNEKTQRTIRSTAGRFVGQAFDEKGRSCRVIVLSTREQHIKREKANSNICSNEAFIATIAGATVLHRGEDGLAAMAAQARECARELCQKLLAFEGVDLAYEDFFNEFTLRLNRPVAEVQEAARSAGLLAGVDVSERGEGHLLKLSLSDRQSSSDVEALVEVFATLFGPAGASVTLPELSASVLREGSIGLMKVGAEELYDYYRSLGHQNMSPDSTLYPLGSCTMKYNPHLNDAAAAIDGFQNAHPQAPEQDAQGTLELLHEIQEWFKAITGLPGVTTQPLAGAQGELVGLKLFQAYHEHRGEGHRGVVIIPRSAHGTNPATATMAGFKTGKVDGKPVGIVTLNALDNGQIDMEHFESILGEVGNRLCGVMITNPNTSGLFETEFRTIADRVHDVGGLVYMDGANMNAIAGWVDLGKLGVDAVHNNLHKTWSIPHGGGGPGDAIVAVSEPLVPFLPGLQIKKEGDLYRTAQPEHSMGSIHRHFGNVGHKVRCYAYLKALGSDGIRRMSAVAVLSARYLFARLAPHFDTLPARFDHPVMHEFIITLPPELFESIQKAGLPKAKIISSFGKLFLDFGFHAPTVSFPEVFGIMIEPTESYTKAELDRFADAVIAMKELVVREPSVLLTAPHFTPIDRVDEVSANKKLVLSEAMTALPEVLPDRLSGDALADLEIDAIVETILAAHREDLAARSA